MLQMSIGVLRAGEHAAAWLAIIVASRDGTLQGQAPPPLQRLVSNAARPGVIAVAKAMLL